VSFSEAAEVHPASTAMFFAAFLPSSVDMWAVCNKTAMLSVIAPRKRSHINKKTAYNLIRTI